ncbi:S8 family serine peptidase [bacterium]|nr:S8 family serine peptidase [bacterium]
MKLRLTLTFLALNFTTSFALTPRNTIYSPNQKLVTEGVYLDKIEIKLKENNGFSFSEEAFSCTNQNNLLNLNFVLQKHSVTKIEKTFTSPANVLDSLKTVAENKLGKELPDYNLFFVLNFPQKTKTTLQNLLDELNRLTFVEIAFPSAIPQLPVCNLADLAPTTSNFQNSQGYLNPAPLGVDAYFAWTQAGGNGLGVKIIDLENAWNNTHEDFCIEPNLILNGTNVGTGDTDHGTAVLGEMVGQSNGYGVTGIANGASAGVHSWAAGGNYGNTINFSSLSINEGDFILLEVHIPGPNYSGSGQFGLVPCEWSASAYFAIQLATGNGRIVVEAAGNGEQNLDAPEYNGWFANSQSSGAIIVGAGTSAGVPEWYTNYGETVDLNGWGSQVYTTGYGDIFDPDQNQLYTATFSGTSSASPIVTGALACLQGIYKNLTNNVFTLSAEELRQLFVTSGSPQDTTSYKKIGPRPNIQGAFNLLGGTLSGVLRDSFGNPVENAKVTSQTQSVYTDFSGNYSILAPQGLQTVSFYKFGYEPLILSKNFLLGQVVQEDTALVVSQKIDFSGNVLSQNTLLPVKSKIELFANYGTLDEIKLTTLTDNNGNFTFSQLPVSQTNFLNYTKIKIVPFLNYEVKAFYDTLQVIFGMPGKTYELKETQVLLVDDDFGDVYEQNYLLAFDELGVSYYVWDVSERGEILPDTLNLLLNRNVVWETGSIGNGLTTQNKTNLENFLLSGGNLFLAGENVANTVTNSNLANNFLGASLSTGTAVSTSFVKGNVNDQIGGGKLFSLSVFTQNLKDALSVSSGTVACKYGTGGANGNAIVYNFGANWKTLISGFSLSAIGSSANPNLSKLSVLLGNTFVWWGILAEIEEDFLGLPKIFELKQNFPNPFNPTTTISYELANSVKGRLTIFNVLGEVVREFELVNTKGEVIWESLDFSGKQVSSGVYFYKLESGNFSQTKKMLLLK